MITGSEGGPLGKAKLLYTVQDFTFGADQRLLL